MRPVAVIGGGVSGLTAAYLLSRSFAVTLYEAEGRLGGHAHTHEVRTPSGGTVALDTGFLVHNVRRYPNLVRLFGELGVRTQPADMSLSVSCQECGLEYLTGSGLRDFSAQARRFDTDARRVLESGDDRLTLADMLAEGYDDYFVQHVVLPLVSAVWSCGPGSAASYPARYLLRFLDHHGLLAGSEATRWRGVTGGSHHYVRAVREHITEVRLSSPVQSVSRTSDGVEVIADGADRYAAVVIATHPDQALRMLADPSAVEREVLGAITYVRNDVVLHTDGSVLPKDVRNQASWNVAQRWCSPPAGQPATVHYHLNRLQRLGEKIDYVVTLNPADPLGDTAELARLVYAHPLYTPSSVAARRKLAELNTGVTVYAGAYHGWGFHEDGCASGVRAAAALGVTW